MTINDIYQLGLEEFTKYNKLNKVLFDLAYTNGQKLADEYKADKDVICIVLAMMDYKIADAIKNNIVEQHVEMSIEAAKIILNEKYNSDKLDHILNCIKEHHGATKYSSIESEICANADCYKFIHPQGFMAYIASLGKRFDNMNDILNQAEIKLDEKYNLISLPSVKSELEQTYQILKALIKDSKPNN